MKILTNLPLESFEPRENYPEFEVVTYGPPDRMWVDRAFYGFDVAFDPSTGSVHDLLRELPGGFTPDILLIYWPDQEPVPDDLANCPVPVVGVISDYNLALPCITGLWPLFDTLLVDRQGVELFERLSFADTRYYCQYTFKTPSHRIYPDTVRDLDIAFAGNLNPAVQRDRTAWIDRLRRLSSRGLKVEVRNDVFGEAYGRFLNRTCMGFNRAIRGEMNLRAFEVPACGALLLMERSNLEVRDFLVPGAEVVLYGDDDFEDVVLQMAGDPRRCRAIAAAGHRRVQEYRMGNRLAALATLLAEPGPGKIRGSGLECALGRGVAMLQTWARGPAPIAVLVGACHLAPDDPRPLNALALAMVHGDPLRFGSKAIETLLEAWALSRTYVPAAFNLAVLLESCGSDLAPRLREDVLGRLAQAPTFADLDGPTLPLGYGDLAVNHSLALGEAVRQMRTEPYAVALRDTLAATCSVPAECQA